MPLEPTILAELDDLERALAGEPSTFTALVADVRATRPVMTPEFQARLDARVDAARSAPPRRSWLAWSPLAGLAAAAVIVVVVAGGGNGGSRTAKLPSGVSSSPSVAASAPKDSAAGGTAATEQTAPSQALAPQSRATLPGGVRKVERNTTLALSTARSDVQQVADGVVATTQRFGGIVDSSQVSTSDADASAEFALRIPTARLDDAVAALSKLAHVASLSQGSTDITGSFVSVIARLGDARAERRALLRALAHATTAQQVDALKARLRDNRSQIAADKGELNALRRRADLARVEVTVAGNGHKGAGGGSGSWTPGDAARDALRVLEVAAGVILIGLAAGVPLALLGGAGALTARATRRRRREMALDV